MERPPALQERIFTRLFEAAEIAKFTKEEYDSYEDSLKVYRDWKRFGGDAGFEPPNEKTIVALDETGGADPEQQRL